MAVDVNDTTVYTGDAVERYGEPVDTSVDTQEAKLVAPDMADDNSIVDFMKTLSMRENKHGVALLKSLVTKCRRNIMIADSQYDHIKRSVARLNGVRTPLEHVGDKSRSLRNTAKRFYESLNTQSLRMQCQLFGVTYDTFDTQEEIITALVDKHVAMNV